MSRKSALMHKMQIKGGLRADDAAAAADIAIQELRQERNQAIRRARDAGLSFRQIAKAFGISHVLVIQVVSGARSNLPPAAATLTPAE